MHEFRAAATCNTRKARLQERLFEIGRGDAGRLRLPDSGLVATSTSASTSDRCVELCVEMNVPGHSAFVDTWKREEGGGEAYVQMKNWNKMAKMMEFAPVEVNACLVYVTPDSGGKSRSSWQYSIWRQPKTAQQTEITRKTMMAHEETENMMLLAFFRNTRGGRDSKRQIAKAPKTWHATNEEKDDDGMQSSNLEKSVT